MKRLTEFTFTDSDGYSCLQTKNVELWTVLMEEQEELVLEMTIYGETVYRKFSSLSVGKKFYEMEKSRRLNVLEKLMITWLDRYIDKLKEMRDSIIAD